MTHANEYTLVEKPLVDALTDRYGYRLIPPETHPTLRAMENEVLFRPLLVDALVRINGIGVADAEAAFHELAGLTDNQRWLDVLRGQYSRKLPGEATHRTLRLIDFDNLANNDFAVTRQLRVQGAVVRKPDVVIYVNGIPLVVIEAKSLTSRSQNAFDAIDQVRSAEKEVPRLFHSNLFNIATNDLTLMYGATGSPSEHWARWRDPWPKAAADFTDETEKGLYALLEPSRLLDLLAHYVVFETREGKTVKKICRYQQLRAVNKMVERVVQGQHRAGLIWHTQGSGKSLTMVFAALKLKFHRGITSPRLQNPNLLVITDRVDLHNQIAATFEACGLPNPEAATSIAKLRDLVRDGVSGRTVLSTIFKFQVDDPRLRSSVHKHRTDALRDLAVADSENWIVLVDEAHRTQEKDLGAFLRAVLPNAVRFGFTGTPVKKGDKDTFTNFGAKGETYLDKYGIQDAVNDGATVPIYYVSRKTEWHLHDKEIDVVFDQWFLHEPQEVVDELKRRGVTRGDLARFRPRIDLIALDIWAHYRKHVAPDGFKAQICAIDREACVAYKQALDRVITRSLMASERLDEASARAKATAMSVCVYSPGQHDSEQHPELVTHQIDPDEVSRTVVPNFLKRDHPLTFLIVCNKLLTGFDAPIEQTLYLDNPLTDHNLLQAIARTNRRYGAQKDHGLIVDYIGVSHKLADALASYNREDVQAAMHDTEVQHDQLRAAHKAVMALVAGVPVNPDPKQDWKDLLDHIATEDAWYVFRGKLDAFLHAYTALSPDPRVLPFQVDLKRLGVTLRPGRMRFEQVEETDWKRYSTKLRAMLDEHLEVTSLNTVCKLHSLSDPAFWQDFADPADLQTAAVRKLTELKKETSDRSAKNAARYERFSDRIKELIQQFSAGLLDAAKVLEETQRVAEALRDEDAAHEGSGLNPRAYGIAAILQNFREPSSPPVAAEPGAASYGGASVDLTPLQRAAGEIDALYASDASAPTYWQDKPELRRELRGKVRRIVQHLGLQGWQQDIPLAVDQHAAVAYRKP
ncbi:MAG: hypothetical protein RLZZ383_1021 [Pseudomonadota bacterium]